MSKTWDGSGGPRAVIHKRILDVARDSPDASLADIASEVSGANEDLVDRVLAEYGDPGETVSHDNETAMSQNGTQSAEGGQTADETESDATESDASERAEAEHESSGCDDTERVEPLTDPEQLTQKQLETLRPVYDDAGVTQGDIADRLGVTRATVSRRLSGIPGFEWTDRESFVATLFEDTEYDVDPPSDDVSADATTADDSVADESEPNEQPTETGADDTEHVEALDEIETRLATVEESVESDDTATERPVRRELAHKTVHAAMESDRITEDEELELIDALLD